MCTYIYTYIHTHASTVNKLLVSLQYTLGEPCRLLLLRVWGLGFRVVGRTFDIGI